MGNQCAKCGVPSKLAVEEGGLCLPCTMGWHKDGPDAGIAGLRELLECNPKAGEKECGECLSCEKEKRVIAEAALAGARKKVEPLKVALAFYADPKSHKVTQGRGFTSPPLVSGDAGKKARFALGLPR